MNWEHWNKKPYWKRYSTLSREAKKEYHRIKMKAHREKKTLEKIYLLRNDYEK